MSSQRQCPICGGEHEFQQCQYRLEYLNTPDGPDRQKLVRRLWSENDPEMASLWRDE